MKKQLADDKLLKELRDSAFFRGRISPAAAKAKPLNPNLATKKENTNSLRQAKSVPPSTPKSELTASPYFTPPRKKKRRAVRGITKSCGLAI